MIPVLFISAKAAEEQDVLQSHTFSKKQRIIYYVKRKEGLYDIGGSSCFVTNGAYSVDKYYRLENGYSWFPDEELSDEEMAQTLAKAGQAGSVDYVFSHTCPAKYMPTFMFIDGIDKSKVSHRMEEFYDQLEETLDYKRWWCGHYHTDWTIDKMRFMYYDILELKKASKKPE